MRGTPERDPRPLAVRLAEYRDATALIPAQLQDIIDRLPAGLDPEPLRDAQKFYTLVSADLTRLVNGERLQPFRIEGVIPS